MISPKQRSKSGGHDWYPYYAGFSQDFVSHLLETDFKESQDIIDPWNGSGTTTAVGLKHSRAVTGLDINPVCTVMARGRIMPRSNIASIRPLALKLLAHAQESKIIVREDDMLLEWMRPSSAARVRALDYSIYEHLVSSQTDSRSEIETWTSQLSPISAFFYCALFAAVRTLFARFKSSNPMWMTKPDSKRQRLGPTWLSIERNFIAHLDTLANRLIIENDGDIGPNFSVFTRDISTLKVEASCFDGAITSPPYATRIDYVKGAVPELACLGVSASRMRNLRSSSIGTPTLSGWSGSTDSLMSESAKALVRKVKAHPSKGSSRYYTPWLATYIEGLQAGFTVLSNSVEKEKPIAIVVQDSYYKELQIDLQEITKEIFLFNGRPLVRQVDFPAVRLRSRMNPRAMKYIRARTNRESVLVFK